ncbi:MAG TPA: hypothetical protein VM865_07320 [Acidobacteriaceae bacterium]|nr:hypothetical protein [Acidobacteriaceae bacterium]
MVRPCFLVLDREHASSISTRKLVIETAKFNVITAYSGEEAWDTVREFPAIHGAVLNAYVQDIPCAELVARFKEFAPELPIVVVRGPGAYACEGADFYVDSFDPSQLLQLLQKLQPRRTAAIEAHEVELKKREEGE